MRRNSARSDLASNPMIIGAATALVALVAMVLSYNANNGLPFVPTYDIQARLPNAAELTQGNEVRIGGKRVGVVTAISAEHAKSGRTSALLDLKLDADAGPLPRDTEARVRPRSPLGLRYLELKPGRSRRTIAAGGILPLAQAQPIVELDEVLNTFDKRTRAALQGVVTELGNGLAGRGPDVNQAIAALNPLFGHLTPVAANLRSRATDLRGLIAGLEATTSALAPVSRPLGGLVESAATTVGALASVRGELGQAIDEAPATEATATRSLHRVRPVLADAAALMRALEPGTRLLPRASRRLATALETGTPVLRRATALADRLGETLGALGSLAAKPATGGSVRKLVAVVSSLKPTLEFVNPFQIRCNYLGLWTRNATSAISEGDANGTWFRFIPIASVDEIFQRADPAPNLHVNTYPHTGQNGECEAGNEPYLPGQQIGNVPGDQGGVTQDTAPPAGVGRP